MVTFEEQCKAAITSGSIRGYVLAARSRSGDHYSQARGARMLPDGTKVPLQTSDVLFVASCTKLITTIAALQCVEKGLLSLDADLRPQLPTLTSMGVLNGFSDTQDGHIEPIRKPLTLRHLLTHSSGLSYDYGNAASMRWRTSNPHAKPSGKGVTERFLMPLVFQPGEGWEYGVGIDWVGHLVEEVTSMRLDQYIRENILKPLELPSSGFSFVPVAEGLADRMTDVNLADPDGYGIAVSNGFNIHEPGSDACYGGSGGYATTETFIAILESILKNDSSILSPRMVEEMHKAQLEPLARDAFNINPIGTLSYDDATNTRTDRDHGLGGVLVTRDNDPCGLAKGSLCWGGGMNSAWAIDPVNGICVFAAPQLTLPIDRKVAQSLRAAAVHDLPGLFEATSEMKA